MSSRKESVCPLSTDNTVMDRMSDGYPTGSSGAAVYPFVLVLRLRVLQVMCGMSALVVGTIAFIEERGDFNLAMAIPAGGATILAAGGDRQKRRVAWRDVYPDT
jgi:hypothetical protein